MLLSCLSPTSYSSGNFSEVPSLSLRYLNTWFQLVEEVGVALLEACVTGGGLQWVSGASSHPQCTPSFPVCGSASPVAMAACLLPCSLP